MTRGIRNLVYTFALSLNISSNCISVYGLFVFVDKLWMTVLLVHYATRLFTIIQLFFGNLEKISVGNVLFRKV